MVDHPPIFIYLYLLYSNPKIKICIYDFPFRLPINQTIAIVPHSTHFSFLSQIHKWSKRLQTVIIPGYAVSLFHFPILIGNYFIIQQQNTIYWCSVSYSSALRSMNGFQFSNFLLFKIRLDSNLPENWSIMLILLFRLTIDTQTQKRKKKKPNTENESCYPKWGWVLR